MKTVTQYSLIPQTAIYLGSEHPDGTMEECTADAIDDAIDPVCFRDEEGQRHFFDLVD
jgi:hypothetical protein